jgi:hypothetical protein
MVWPTPTTATALELVSDDNTNDIPAGTGARSVTIYGIKDWTTGEESATIALNGTTPVAAGSWLRVYRMMVASSGTYATQTGASHDSTITLRVASAGATWSHISPAVTGFGAGQTQMAVYSAPTGKSVYVDFINILVEASKQADVFLYVREGADTIAAPFNAMNLKAGFRMVDGQTDVDYHFPLGPFVGPCDIGFMAASTPSGTADISIRFDIIEVDG